MLGKKLINSGPISGGANTFASENFNTVLYTGNGGTQRIGGYINRGAVFNGSSSYITIPINKLTNTFSFSTWLYLDDLSTSYRWVFGNWNSTTQDLYVMIRDTGIIEVNPDGNNGTVAFGSSGAFSTNTWHHLVVSMDAGTYTVYLDGSSLGSGSTTNTTFNNGYNYQIGKTPNSSINEWSGKIDQFRLFDKAISSSEVTTLYGETFASTTISTTDIFDDNSGVALYQLDGNANDTGGASGKFGEAAIFNGSNSSIYNNSIDTATTKAVSIWVKADDFSERWPFQQGDGQGTENYIRFYNTDDIQVRWGNVTQTFSGYSSDTWYHIVAQTDASGYANVWINGTEVGTSSSPSTLTVDRTNIGVRYNNGSFQYYFKGFIDEVRLYTDSLTDAEIGYLYNNTTASIPTDNLQAYYKLNGNAVDEQGLYDGTASNVIYKYDGTASNITYQEATKFSPDLVWIKERTNASHHALFDSVRGNQYLLSPNQTIAQIDQSANPALESFDTNGFTVDQTNTSNYYVNRSSQTYVAWCFNAGTDAAASNTDGSITSTVKANPDAGFSIVNWTGSTSTSAETVGHGLSSAPELVILKNRDASDNWYVFANGVTSTSQTLKLNSSSGVASTSTMWGSGMTDNVAGIRPGSFVSSSSHNVIMYCFHSVTGYQKIGSYTGNGSSSKFVETGFEPAFVMIKNTTTAYRWYILDNKRDATNPNSARLFADSSAAEATNQGTLNFLSNGFEVITPDAEVNKNGDTMIYLAIAADPDTTTPTVENSFDVVTYTGNGGTQSISTDFKPDLVWVKNRTVAVNNYLYDSIRGTGAAKALHSNTADSESTASIYSLNGGVQSIDSNGFTVFEGTDGTYQGTNKNGNNYVAWCFKAGDHDDSLPQINTEGTIDSVVSVNDAAGFSIVTWTGDGNDATVGHGLSSQPELVITKGRANLATYNSWITYHKDLSTNHHLYLNTNDSEQDGIGDYFRDASFSSTVIGLGDDIYGPNVNGTTMVAYCFTSITGHSKIGSYSGSNYPITVTTGFKPRFVLIKRTDASGNSWVIIDSAREIGSGADALFPDLSAAESSSWNTDFISTGFTISSNESYISASGGTYIYMAFK